MPNKIATGLSKSGKEAPSRIALAANNCGSVPNKNAKAPHKTYRCRRCTTEHSSNCFSAVHSVVQAADRSGSRLSYRHSSSCGHHSTVKKAADSRCKRAHLIVNSHSPEPGCCQNPPTAAGPHARS